MHVMHIMLSILAFLWFVSFIFFLLRVWHVCRNRRTLRFGGSEKLMAIANCKTKMLYAARPSQFHIWRRRWACGISIHVTKIYCKDGSYKSRSKIYFVFFLLLAHCLNVCHYFIGAMIASTSIAGKFYQVNFLIIFCLSFSFLTVHGVPITYTIGKG